MKQSLRSVRTFLCFFSGEDAYIIGKCSMRIQFYFAFIGLFVQLIFLGCLLSAGTFTHHLFPAIGMLSIPMAGVWAALLICIYLLLLYTISPLLLPIEEDARQRVQAISVHPLRSASMLFRLILIIFIAVIVAQPLNVTLFGDTRMMKDAYTKAIRLTIHHAPGAWVLTLVTCVIFLLPIHLKFRIRNIPLNRKNKGDVQQQNIREIVSDMQANPGYTDAILTMDMGGLRTNDYYFQKTLIEYRLILEAYTVFKQRYQLFLTRKVAGFHHETMTNLQDSLQQLKACPARYNAVMEKLQPPPAMQVLERFEYWADPPFRTVRKPSTFTPMPEQDLLHHFYADPH